MLLRWLRVWAEINSVIATTRYSLVNKMHSWRKTAKCTWIMDESALMVDLQNLERNAPHSKRESSHWEKTHNSQSPKPNTPEDFFPYIWNTSKWNPVFTAFWSYFYESRKVKKINVPSMEKNSGGNIWYGPKQSALIYQFDLRTVYLKQISKKTRKHHEKVEIRHLNGILYIIILQSCLFKN